MASQYSDVTVTPVLHRRAVIDATPVTMTEAQFATGLIQRGEKYHVCNLCNLTYPESKLSQVGGNWYCNRFKHAAEKASLLA
jgi:hypothetical protein